MIQNRNLHIIITTADGIAVFYNFNLPAELDNIQINESKVYMNDIINSNNENIIGKFDSTGIVNIIFTFKDGTSKNYYGLPIYGIEIKKNMDNTNNIKTDLLDYLDKLSLKKPIITSTSAETKSSYEAHDYNNPLLNLFNNLEKMLNSYTDVIDKLLISYNKTDCKNKNQDIQNDLINIKNLLKNQDLLNYISNSKTDSVNISTRYSNNATIYNQKEIVDSILNFIYQNNTNQITPIFNILDNISKLLDKLIKVDDASLLCIIEALQINAELHYSKNNNIVNDNTFKENMRTEIKNKCEDEEFTNYKGVDIKAVQIQKLIILSLNTILFSLFSFDDYQLEAIEIISDFIVKLLTIFKKGLLFAVKMSNYIDKEFCKENKFTPMIYNHYRYFMHAHKEFYAYVTVLNNLKIKTKKIGEEDENDRYIDNLITQSGINKNDLKISLNDSKKNKKPLLFSVNSSEHFNHESSSNNNIFIIIVIVLVIAIVYLLYKRYTNKQYINKDIKY
jgi:hypothetical protein